MVDQETIDLRATKASLGTIGVLFGLDFDLPRKRAQISKVNQKYGVVEGYFFVVALACGLRFPLLSFIIELLDDYKIAPS